MWVIDFDGTWHQFFAPLFVLFEILPVRESQTRLYNGQENRRLEKPLQKEGGFG